MDQLNMLITSLLLMELIKELLITKWDLLLRMDHLLLDTLKKSSGLSTWLTTKERNSRNTKMKKLNTNTLRISQLSPTGWNKKISHTTPSKRIPKLCHKKSITKNTIKSTPVIKKIKRHILTSITTRRQPSKHHLQSTLKCQAMVWPEPRELNVTPRKQLRPLPSTPLTSKLSTNIWEIQRASLMDLSHQMTMSLKWRKNITININKRNKSKLQFLLLRLKPSRKRRPRRNLKRKIRRLLLRK